VWADGYSNFGVQVQRELYEIPDWPLGSHRTPMEPNADLTPPGLAASDMNAKQRELLMQLIDVYASQMTPDVAAERLTAIRKAGIEKITFAWAGSIEPNERHYYRVQGPTFLIEFDNTQNNANHIHTVWRDFDGDFGRDLLREHYRNAPHPALTGGPGAGHNSCGTGTAGPGTAHRPGGRVTANVLRHRRSAK
jgi:hypothetical protein